MRQPEGPVHIREGGQGHPRHRLRGIAIPALVHGRGQTESVLSLTHPFCPPLGKSNRWLFCARNGYFLSTTATLRRTAATTAMFEQRRHLQAMASRASAVRDPLHVVATVAAAVLGAKELNLKSPAAHAEEHWPFIPFPSPVVDLNALIRIDRRRRRAILAVLVAIAVVIEGQRCLSHAHHAAHLRSTAKDALVRHVRTRLDGDRAESIGEILHSEPRRVWVLRRGYNEEVAEGAIVAISSGDTERAGILRAQGVAVRRQRLYGGRLSQHAAATGHGEDDDRREETRRPKQRLPGYGHMT